MKKNNIVVGLVLIFVGIFWFLDSISVFQFSFSDFFSYLRHIFKVWPLFIIYLGIKLVTDNKIVSWTYIGISLTFIVFYSLAFFLDLDILNFI